MARPGGSHVGGGYMEWSGLKGRIATGPRAVGVKSRSVRDRGQEMPE